MSEELLLVAKNVILNSPAAIENLPEFWQKIDASAFVTAYKHLPPTSANVWCCMSNGNYDLPGPVLSNVIESAHICATKDTRIDSSIVPSAFEVCLFVPQHLWINLGSMPAEKMQRSLQRAFLLSINASQRAVYLPDVWNEYKEWTAKDLLNHLARKAGSDLSKIDTVYEIPCYVISEQTSRDRGFFATLILERAWEFYNHYKKRNQLAYYVTKDNVMYDNEGAWVRSLGDVKCFHKLAKLLGKDSKDVVDDALAIFAANDPSSLAAKISLQSETHRSLDVKDVEKLVNVKTLEYGFEKPQIIIALCIAYKYFNKRDHLLLRQRIETVVADYFGQNKLIESAFKKHGAFAANWYLQAVAATKKTKWSCLSTNCGFKPLHVEKAIEFCRKALQVKRSITEEACAAHGLLVSQQFTEEDMFEHWAEYQYRWNMHGGFRYRFNEDWYRTDVTSHVVEVCFLARQMGRNGII